MIISSSKRMNTTVYNTASRPKKFITLNVFNSTSNSISPIHSLQKKRIKNTKHTKRNKIPNLTSRTSLFIDLVKQSKLAKEKHISYDRDYYFNLLKIQLKKKIRKNLPKIKDLSLTKPLSNVNSKANNLFNTTNYLRSIDREKDKNKTFSYRHINKHIDRQKKKELYKSIIDEDKQNLRMIYVNKILSSDLNKNENSKNDDNINNNINNGNENIKIKNKIESKDYNLNMSKIRFLLYHGFNKKSKNNEFNLQGKYEINKFKEMDVKIMKQLFLKNKINNVYTQMKTVQKDVDATKKKLNTLFNTLNKDIEFDLNLEYKKD